MRGIGSTAVCLRSLLQNHVRPVSRVRVSASSFIQASMRTAPVPCSCTMAGTRPSALYLTAARSDDNRAGEAMVNAAPQATTGQQDGRTVLLQLLAEVARGNKSAFARLYGLTHAKLLGVALLIVLLLSRARRGPNILLQAQGRGDGQSLGYLGPFLAGLSPLA